MLVCGGYYAGFLLYYRVTQLEFEICYDLDNKRKYLSWLCVQGVPAGERDEVRDDPEDGSHRQIQPGQAGAEAELLRADPGVLLDWGDWPQDTGQLRL